MAANDNPFFALQSRLAALLEAHAYFAGLTAAKGLLTEQVGDLEYHVFEVMIPLGFGVVVTTASGKPLVNDYEALVTLEDLNVTLSHNPSTRPDKNLLDAVHAAIEAIHGQSVQAQPPAAARPHDFFAVTGHQRRFDGPKGTHVHEVHVQAGLRLL